MHVSVMEPNRDSLKTLVASSEIRELESDRDETQPMGEFHRSATDNSPPWLDEAKARNLDLPPVAPVDIFIYDLSIRLDIKSTVIPFLSSFRKNRDEKESPEIHSRCILEQVSAYMPAGTITAIMGATGSGKSTLLNVLSRRVRDSHLHQSGRICYSGHHSDTGVLSAYVTQQDILPPTLTVRETLQYAAELRLPPSTSAQERHILVEEVITELGLTHCADTRIGDETRRGCSGGEKRRTSLAIQLLVNPSVLFLDEVTTGLDTTGAFQIVSALKQLARRGKTIVMTIHQPRSEIWSLFDHILLLAGGSPLYSGPTSSCLQHFERLGFPHAPFINPAEYLIDLATVDHRTAEREESSTARVEQLRVGWRKFTSHVEASNSGVDALLLNEERNRPPTGFFRQLKVQTQRTFKTTWRDPWGCFGSLVECLVMSILTGWIFFQLDESQSGIRSREGALYITMTLQNYLIMLYETFQLTREIGIFDRERAEGVVGVASFLVSRRLANLFLTDLPVPFIYSVIFYFMTGFRVQAAQFFTCFTFVLLTHYASVTFAAVGVAISRDFAGASLIANLNSSLQVLCSGFLIQSNQMPVYVRWLKYITYVWYGNGALVTNEFIGTSDSPSGYLYDCPYPGGSSNPACAPWTGHFVVNSLGFPSQGWIWRPAVILVAFVAVFLSIAGLILTFNKAEMRVVRPKAPKPIDLREAMELPTYKPLPSRPLPVVLKSFGLEIEKRGWFAQKIQVIPILQPLNVEFQSGMLNVILGASGSGKTSLLNLMTQRFSSTYTTRYKPTGTMMIDGLIPSTEMVRSMTSYVCQSDDTLLPNLTVRETLFFAAQLRLPTWLSPKEKELRAQKVLTKLGLQDCADNIVGNDQIKGISGGEKRRVSIAIQLITEPRILVLDEPTSGLDAFTAASLLSTLQGLAAENSTIVLSIHQPRSDVFHLFGSVLLLARGGHIAYSGPGKDMLLYFRSQGYICPDKVNPADFALDLINPSSKSTLQPLNTSETSNHLVAAWALHQSHNLSKPIFQASLASHSASLGSYERQQTPTRLATRLLLHRSTLSFIRSRPAILARTAQLLGITILSVLFFAPLKHDFSGIQSHVGFLQHILAVYFVGMLQNIAIYPAEKAVFDTEHLDDVYRVEPFFISYTVLELPLEILTSVVFGILSTFAVGLPRTGTVFAVMTFVCFGLVSCGESIGMIFNTLFRSTGFAVSIVSVILSLGLVMSGVLSTHLNGFLGAVNHLSPGKWSMAAMAPYTLRGVSFTCGTQEMVEGRCPIQTGEDVLELYNLDPHGGMALVYIAVLIVGYRALAYVVLKFEKKEWRLSVPLMERFR